MKVTFVTWPVLMDVGRIIRKKNLTDILLSYNEHEHKNLTCCAFAVTKAAKSEKLKIICVYTAFTAIAMHSIDIQP